MLQWVRVWDNSPTLMTTAPGFPPASDIDGTSPILTTSGLDTCTASIGPIVLPWRGAGPALPSAETHRVLKSSPAHMITGSGLPLDPSVAGCLRGVSWSQLTQSSDRRIMGPSLPCLLRWG